MKNAPDIFSGRTVFIRGKPVDMAYPIADAFQIEDIIVVLLDPDAYTEKFGQFRNLIALTVDGNVLWTAELPTTMSSDTYYRVSSRNPLIADSFSSYACEIDQSSGKIKRRTFFK